MSATQPCRSTPDKGFWGPPRPWSSPGSGPWPGCRRGGDLGVTRTRLAGGEREVVGPFPPVGRFGLCSGRLRERFEGVIRRFRTGSRRRGRPSGSAPGGRSATASCGGGTRAPSGLAGRRSAEAVRGDGIDMSPVGAGSAAVRAPSDASGTRGGRKLLPAGVGRGEGERKCARPRVRVAGRSALSSIRQRPRGGPTPSSGAAAPPWNGGDGPSPPEGHSPGCFPPGARADAVTPGTSHDGAASATPHHHDEHITC